MQRSEEQNPPCGHQPALQLLHLLKRLALLATAAAAAAVAVTMAVPTARQQAQ